MHFRKAQTAVELLGVYGWVILLILLILVIVYYSGYLSFETLFPPYCSFTSTLTCRTFKFGYTPDGRNMVLTFKLVNGLGYDILLGNNSTVLTVENVGKPGRNQYNITCRPTNVPIRQGNIISCIIIIPDTALIPTVGRNVNFQLQTTYLNCNEGPNYTVNRNCSGAPSLMIAGTIRTPMEPPSLQLWSCGSGFCDYMLGENPSNCCSDCPVTLTLTAFPNPVNQSQTTVLTATAQYFDGTPAANATVYFTKDKGWNTTDLLICDNNTANYSVSDANGIATANYTSTIPGPMMITASSCGPAASATIIVLVGYAPPNGTILFSYSPPEVPAGGSYNVNITVYNSTGGTVPSSPVILRTSANSNVNPVTAITDLNGVAQVVFSSDVMGIGTLWAQVPAIGMINSTPIWFGPPGGGLMLWNDGPGNVSSEGAVDIFGCLYDPNGDPVQGALINLTTNFGNFVTTSGGQQRMPTLTTFTSGRGTSIANIPPGVGYTIYGYNSTVGKADPIEFDAYAGKFVKIDISGNDESRKAGWITDYLNLKRNVYSIGATNGRTVYIFYNTSYVANAMNATLFYNNLTYDLSNAIPPIPYVVVSNPQVLRDKMLNHANTSIVILSYDWFPTDVWECEADGGVPKLFFQRGGIQIQTADWEFYGALLPNGQNCQNGGCVFQNPNPGGGNCWEQGGIRVLGWETVGYGWQNPYDSFTSNPVNISNTVQQTTYVGGCFNSGTDHPTLYYGATALANVTATYSTMSNYTMANFSLQKCVDGTVNDTCSPGNAPKLCIQGYLADKCDRCGCPDPANQVCDMLTGSCMGKPGAILLYLTTFNGTGNQLVNDSYTYLQVVAQVVNNSGSLLANVPISWTSSNVLIASLNCNATTNNPPGCGDISALPSPAFPRASIFIVSNGSWTGIANVTANITIGGVSLSNTTYVTVTNDTSVNSVRWPGAYPSVVPADNYTISDVCASTFNKNDSALGNETVCFNTTVGTWENGLMNMCTSTDQYGEHCLRLKSSTPGNANVSVTIQGTGTPFQMLSKLTFYAIPDTIVINVIPSQTPPCADCNGIPPSPFSQMIINATFFNSSPIFGGPVVGIPYVYFTPPKGADYITSAWRNSMVAPWGPDRYQYWSYLIPAYDPNWQNCAYTSFTNGTCSAQTMNDGSAYSNFSPVYPPGIYPINVSTWYDCNTLPYSPVNCLNSTSNTTLVSVIPFPKTTIIVGPSRSIKPNGFDNATINATVYGSTGLPLPRVYYFSGVGPWQPGSQMAYTLTEPYYTNSSGGANMSNFQSDIPGNFMVSFDTFYYTTAGWQEVDNYTIVKFTNVSIINVTASPTSTYADGVYCSQITINVTDTTGSPMSNLYLGVQKPLTGVIGCCNGSSCPCIVHTNSSGQYATRLCSTTPGISVPSAFVEYGQAPASGFGMVVNATSVMFKPPPVNAVLTANPTTINNDGVSNTLITAKLEDVYSGPTPGINVSCNVSDNSVYFPTTNLVTDSTGSVYVNLSSTDISNTEISCFHIGGTTATGSVYITMNATAEPGTYILALTPNMVSTSVGSYINITVNVTNATSGQPAYIPVNFATSYGGSLTSNSGHTDLTGLAYVNATAIGPGSIFVKANVSSGDWASVKLTYH